MKTRKKLIEIALPLEAINRASVREGYIYKGNPSALHKWWAQRPLAAGRAVIFSQIVDDPSEYVDTLRQDAKLRHAAESALKAKRKLWAEAKTLHQKAKGSGVDAPEPGPEPTLDEVLADHERQRLFKIIEQLVVWENTTNEEVLQAARDEIWQSWRRACLDNVDHPRSKELFDRGTLPAFHDPFAGGGTLPLEAQRLGLASYASDLNPVAVLINKAMIELPPRFANREPVNPEWVGKAPHDKVGTNWAGARGLAEDVSYYGRWIRDEAVKRIGHLYPTVEITAAMASGRTDLKPYVGKTLAPIAWLWARTVKSPNPAFADVDVPLVSTFMLSTKAGKEVYVEPEISGGGYRFKVKIGKPRDVARAKNGTKLSRGANFECLMSGTPISSDHIKAEGRAGRLGARLLAIVLEGDRGRIYLSPSAEMEEVARMAKPAWRPDIQLVGKCRDQLPLYGMNTFADLFTPRQLLALSTFSDLVGEARERVRRDASKVGVPEDTKALHEGGVGPNAYAEAVSVYLAFAQDKACEYGSTLVPWYSKEDRPKGLFARQAMQMIWDFAEVNPLSGIGGSLFKSVEIVTGALGGCVANSVAGEAHQEDAVGTSLSKGRIVSTDPPYYDNICYADLSDFFYVWLRHTLRAVYPDLFSTLAVPKAAELVATPYRHNSKTEAEAFFLDGMTQAMHRLAEESHPAFPVTIYYAFKQSESDDEAGTASTGWDTFLAAVIRAGFAITGTWPIRTERGSRSISIGSNALASSIILVCRKRAPTAPIATRRDFVAALKAELPRALAMLQHGNIEPVDLEQAAIGPGMAVYTRFGKVLDAEGNPLTVRQALALINQTLDEALAEQEGDFDPDTRWALVWFDEFGYSEGDFGKANLLATAKATSVAGLATAGILRTRQGKVQLLAPAELPGDWDPESDERLPVWEALHHLIRVLESDGEAAAAKLVVHLGAKAETARELAYRLHSVCARRKRAKEAMAFNGLVQSWPEITRLARGGPAEPTKSRQVDAFDEE